MKGGAFVRMNKIARSLFVGLFLTLGLLGSTSHCEGARNTKIGFMKYEVGEDIDSNIGVFLYKRLVREMLANKKYAIVDWEKIDRVVSSIVRSRRIVSEKEAIRQAVDKLDIQKMCLGSVTKVGGKFHVMVRVVNADQTVDMVLRQSTRSEHGLEGCIISIAHLLVMRLGDADKLQGDVEARQARKSVAKAVRLPSWLVAVRDAKYALVHGLEPGSREAQERQLRAVQELKLPLEVKTRKTGIVFRLVPAGSFIMGSPWSGSVTGSDEGPMHQVTLSRPMYVGKFEITQGQWETVMGYNPSRFKNVGENAPVENVSWKDCEEFCRMLGQLEASQRTAFRLLTEAEWEYSCRAGTVGSHVGAINWISWYHGNSGGRTRQVGTKASNAWGLYDMHGNVWESCQDWYKEAYLPEDVTDPQGPKTGSERVLRGGSWVNSADSCRSAVRHKFWQGSRDYYFGFRIVVPVGE